MTKTEQLRLLTTALCCGDALGATSEFVDQRDMPALYQRHKATGWPFAQIGGGAFNWERGEYTDDGQMAVAMVQSFIQRAGFEPADIAQRWVQWLDSDPPDIGNATRAGLISVKRGKPWHEGGLADFLGNPASAANGSLMRNAPVAAMASSLPQAFEFSLKQSIITHYAPLPVACCCAQTFLLWQFLNGDKISPAVWPERFVAAFTEWVDESQDATVRAWSAKTGEHQPAAWETFLAANFDPQSFNPFGYPFDGRDGYCLLTLQIAAWAAEWSLTGRPFPTPPGFAAEPFAKAVGPSFGAVVPLIGHDSDTYAAVAFPLIAAAHGQIPSQMTEGLRLAKTT